MFMPRTQSEGAFQKRALAFLRQRGGWWTNIAIGPYAAPGLPDIVGCYRGCFVAFELKAPGKYKYPIDGLRPAQARMGMAITAAGGHWACTDSLNIVANTIDFIDHELKGKLGV